MAIRRILMPLAGTTLTPASIATAARLAADHRALLTGISFRESGERAWLSPLGGSRGIERQRDQAEEAAWRRVAECARRFAEVCKAAAIDYDLVTPSGDPFDLLLAHGGSHDLVVFALGGLFDHPLVPDPERLITRLIAGSLGPILAARGEPPAADAPVLVALSGSPASHHALRDLVHLGLQPAAPLHLVHIGDDRPMLERCAALARAHGRSVAAVDTLRGDVAATLQVAARERGCGLIAMGDSGRSLLARDVLGDVALRLLRDGEVPLLLSH